MPNFTAIKTSLFKLQIIYYNMLYEAGILASWIIEKRRGYEKRINVRKIS